MPLARYLNALPRYLKALPRYLNALPRYLKALPRYLLGIEHNRLHSIAILTYEGRKLFISNVSKSTSCPKRRNDEKCIEHDLTF